MNLLLIKAVDFAAYNHRHQHRKGAEATPYINHPIRVARLMAETGRIADPELLAAAVLHDTVEDTIVTLVDIEREFGRQVRDWVDEVSDDRSLPQAERKQQQVEHAPHMSAGGAVIKLADKIDNVREVLHNPPVDWSAERQTTYIEWGKAVVEGLPPVNAELLTLFNRLVDGGNKPG